MLQLFSPLIIIKMGYWLKNSLILTILRSCLLILGGLEGQGCLKSDLNINKEKVNVSVNNVFLIFY